MADGFFGGAVFEVPVDQTPRIELARDSQGDLDDVFVRDVPLFRAEMMHEGHLWMCCYLDDGPDRITFDVTAVKKGVLEFSYGELPDAPVAHYWPDCTAHTREWKDAAHG